MFSRGAGGVLLVFGLNWSLVVATAGAAGIMLSMPPFRFHEVMPAGADVAVILFAVATLYALSALLRSEWSELKLAEEAPQSLDEGAYELEAVDR